MTLITHYRWSYDHCVIVCKRLLVYSDTLTNTGLLDIKSDSFCDVRDKILAPF